jgi:uncharacterized repeat protein (TIGR01451 family)
MSFGIWSKLAVATLVAGSMAFSSGCSSQQKKSAPKEEVKQETAAAPAPRAVRGPCNYSPAAAAGMNVSPMAFPTGDVSTSAVLVHQVVPVQVRAGANYTYELHVTNITSGTLQNVVVHNEGAQNLTVVNSEPTASKGADGGALWMLGDLAPCQTRVIKVTGKADKVGTSSSCSSVSYNNTLCATTTVVEPALQITKQITPEAILGCDPITMTIEVKNSGTGTASNVKITDQLPSGLTTADGKSTLEIAAGDLAQGQSKPFTVALRAAKTGKYDNEAKAVADGGLTATSNKVSTVVRQPVLTVACKPTRETVQARANAEGCFEVTVKNTGDAVSRGTAVSVTATGGTITSAEGAAAGTGNISVGELAAGASKTFKVCVRPNGITQVQLNATAIGSCAAQVASSCTFSVIGAPDIGTLVTDDNVDVVEVGKDHPYRVEIKNQGQVNLTNVKMEVALPQGMTFVSSTTGTFANGKVTFNFGTVTPGKTVMGTFIVRATQSGEMLVVGTTTCSEIKTPVRDDELTNFIGN